MNENSKEIKMTSGEVSIECRISDEPKENGTKAPLSEPSTSSEVKPPAKKSANNFRFGMMIGEGSYSTVFLAKDIQSRKEVAIKVCYKDHIIREKKEKAIMREKQIMNIVNNDPHPFIVKLFCTFQDPEKLFFVMQYARNGMMLPYINKVGSFDEECTRFYTAEMLMAIEHLHKLKIVHRDLKPENILLNEDMHILVSDFGCGALMENEESPEGGKTRRTSFVGTAEYVAPELLSSRHCGYGVDLWALGCIIYQMVSGLPPFRDKTEYNKFQQIQNLDYSFPDGFLPLAKDLVEKLLVVDPAERLGSQDKNVQGYPSVRNHPFLQDIPWDRLPACTPPRILPYLPSTSSNEELRSHYHVPDHIQPGLDDRQMTRLLGLALQDDDPELIPKPPTTASSSSRKSSSSILDMSQEEMLERLKDQADNNLWHRFVQGNVILRQGLVDKRKGLFARRRMLLLTTGPHLYYVDPQNLVLKGEIPWSPELRAEPKNFKIFFVHTPDRTYYLEDPEGFALKWCKDIEDVRKVTYAQSS